MSKHQRKAGECPNCHQLLDEGDNFCKKCGQENHDLNVPFHHLAGEFIEGIFHIDTKFWNTFKAICTSPGKITSDFVVGKRARYMPPARFYIFMSFVFFLLVTVVADKLIKKTGNPKNLTGMMSANIDFDVADKKIKFTREQAKLVSTFTEKQIDSFLVKKNVPITLENREVVRKHAANFDEVLNSILGNGKVLIVEDSVNKKSILLDSNDINQVKNYSSKQLEEFLAAKNIHPNMEDFNDLKDDLGDFKNPQNAKKSNSKTTFNGISSQILDQAPKPLTDANIDSLLTANKITPSFRNRLSVKFYHSYKEFDYERDIHELSHKVLKNLSWVMFLLMPFVAIILLTIYFRSKRNYYEYFIFSIHIHSILFLTMSLELLLRLLFRTESLFPIYSFVIMYFYFLFSLKNVYKQGWIKTIFKFLFLNITYGIVLLLFILATFIWSFATLE